MAGLDSSQVDVDCKLCNRPSQEFCNSCQVSLCYYCVRIHKDEFRNLSHEIVAFKERKIQLVCPECEDHTGQRCEGFCEDCDKPICSNCLLSGGQHNGHSKVRLREAHDSKIKDIKTNTTEFILRTIPNYRIKDDEISSKIGNIETQFEDLEMETKRQRKIWHEEVDIIFAKVDSVRLSFKEANVSKLQSHQSKIRDAISDMNKIVEQNERAMKCNNMFMVNHCHSNLKTYPDVPPNINTNMPRVDAHITPGHKLSIEIDGFVAKLEQKSLRSPYSSISNLEDITINANVIATILTDHKPLYNLVCGKEAKAWVLGKDGKLILININGSVEKTITFGNESRVHWISLTHGSEAKFIYIDETDSTLNVWGPDGREKQIDVPRRWEPFIVSCTRSGTVLVHMREEPAYSQDCSSGNLKNKILQYDKEWNKKDIEVDQDGLYIFKRGRRPLFMTENMNRDICVSDTNGHVVKSIYLDKLQVLDKRRVVRFEYDGKIARTFQTFCPKDIVTDNAGQIIVADYNNECLHILDRDGRFLRFVDNCGLINPLSLSIDKDHRLWVGLFGTGIIKVINYLL